MTDVRAQRCAELAGPVTALMGAALACQSRSSQAFADVIEHAEKVRAIAELGSAGIDDPDYTAWASIAPAGLEAMTEAAQQRDPKAVWAAFAHPEHGMHRVGTACAGLPGWAAPA